MIRLSYNSALYELLRRLDLRQGAHDDQVITFLQDHIRARIGLQVFSTALHRQHRDAAGLPQPEFLQRCIDRRGSHGDGDMPDIGVEFVTMDDQIQEVDHARFDDGRNRLIAGNTLSRLKTVRSVMPDGGALVGVPEEESRRIVVILRQRPKAWVDFMMRFELGLEVPDPHRLGWVKIRR